MSNCFLYPTHGGIVKHDKTYVEATVESLVADTKSLRKYKNIFVIANSYGIRLISELWQADPRLNIVVGSASIMKLLGSKADFSLLMAMSQFCDHAHPEAMWHRLTDEEAMGFMLADKLKAEGGKVDYSKLQSILRGHGIYKFAEPFTSNEVALAVVMGTIISPKLYYNRGKPNRPSKLFRLFDLRPNAFPFHDREGLERFVYASKSTDALAALVRSWYDHTEVFGMAASVQRWPHRLLKEEDMARSVYTACRRYLLYVVIHWAYVMATTQRQELAFVPEYFFKRDDEVEAYKSLLTY